MLSTFKKTPERVSDCLEPNPATVVETLNLSDTLRQMGNQDAVTLLDTSRRVSGIITTWDLANEFSKIYEPFKLLANIEFKLKERIGYTYEPAQIAKIVNGDDYDVGQVVASSQLTFGQMIRVIESESRWKDLRIGLDRGTVIEELKKAVTTRNDLMHFRDTDPKEISRLRRIWGMFRQAL